MNLIGPEVDQEILNSFIGKEIKDGVFLLSAPKWYQRSYLPNERQLCLFGEWRAVANVCGHLCVITVVLEA